MSTKRDVRASKFENFTTRLNLLPIRDRDERIDIKSIRDCDDAMYGAGGLILDFGKTGKDSTDTSLNVGTVYGSDEIDDLEESTLVGYGGIVGSG